MSFNANVTTKPTLLNTAVTNASAGAATPAATPLQSPPPKPAANLEHPFEVLRGAVQHAFDFLGGAIQRGIIIVGGHNSADAVRDQLDNKSKDLQSQDKLGNFEIQGLMSDFNEAQTLSSSILKKKDDAGNAVIQKI